MYQTRRENRGTAYRDADTLARRENREDEQCRYHKKEKSMEQKRTGPVLSGKLLSRINAFKPALWMNELANIHEHSIVSSSQFPS